MPGDSIKKTVAAAALVITVVLAGATFYFWPGAAWPLLTFHGAMITMLAFVFIGPVSYAYGFLATFMFLGFWCKLVVHFILGLSFVEPIGSFDESPVAWDAAVLAAAAAALGVCAARGTQILLGSRQTIESSRLERLVPALYIGHRRLLWSVTLIAVAALNLWNAEAAFYQIGVNPRLILPARLNIVLAWLINWGFALWIACLSHWEIRTRKGAGMAVLMGVIAEALMVSISTLSRSAYLFHALPSMLAWVLEQKNWRVPLRHAALMAAVLVLGLAVSLVAVQTLRTESYLAMPPETSFSGKSTSETAAAARAGMVNQIAFLFIHRWIGLEGVLAVSAYPDKGLQLLEEGVLENPKLGVDTLFQRIAETNYVALKDFTFLTLAGASAVLYYSGSTIIVLVGMALLASLLLLTEVLVRRTTNNPFVAAVAGIAMAYTVTQLTFPYLAAVFFVELWFTLAAIALLERVGGRGVGSPK